MRTVSRILVRLRALVFRRETDAELDEELRYHLEREVERNVANGMAPDVAQAAARRAFGNLSVATEQARDATRWRRIEELRQDIVYAFRTFARAPMFVVTVVATIGLGLGLLSSAFTFFDAYVLRPHAVRDPYSLYEATQSRNNQQHRFTWAEYQRLTAAGGSFFTESFGYVSQSARLRGHPAIGQLVTGNYFQMLGVPPALGRTLVPSDAVAPGGNAVIVLSHQAWRTMFGADSAVIGTRVNVNGTTLAIVGIARDGFGGLGSAPYDFWIPITMIGSIGPVPGLFGPTQSEGLAVVGRLAPGVTAEATTARLSTWLRSETADRAPIERVGGVTLLPRGSSMPRTPEIIALFAPVTIAFLLVLLIACANVGNMMLARGMARQREIGIRLALGAGRGRLIRQLLTEAVVLAVPAGLVGFLVSRATIGVSLAVMFNTVPHAYVGYLRVIPLDVDVRVLTFMMLSAVGAAVLFGLAPALQATRPNIVQASRGDFDTQFRPSRLRNGLVVAQITLSVVLLVCAGVLLSGVRHTERLTPGVRTENIVQVAVLPQMRERSIDALRREPMVRSIASSSSTPLDARFSSVSLIASDRPSEKANYNLVSPEYFNVVDLPIVSGRGFTADEGRSRAPVVVVSRSTARHFWPDADPIGQTLTVATTDQDYRFLARYHVARVIGVTSDAVPGWIGGNRADPTVYYPQQVDANSSSLLVRVSIDAERARARLERTLATVDSGAVQEMHTMEQSLAVQVYPFRAMYWLASSLGVIALLLTLTGVYGVLAYVVAQRRKEFGIRAALGAGSATLIASVLRQSMRLSLIGVGLGLVFALAISRLFASVVVVIDTFDTAGYAGGTALVLVVCLFASYVPSRRAAAANPVEALRADS